MLNQKVMKHTRKVPVSWNSTCPLLNSLQGAKTKCLVLSENTASCFPSFKSIWWQQQTSTGGFWDLPWAKSRSQCIQSYCTTEQEQERYLLTYSRSQIQTLIWGRCIYMPGKISSSTGKISSKESLRSTDKKKTCLTLRCRGHSNSAGLQSFHLMIGRATNEDCAKICSQPL